MIIHLDLDCFFVSAERTRTPFLKNRPVVVCKSGDRAIFSSEDQPSVITDSVGAFNGIFQQQHSFEPYNKEAWKKKFMDENGNIHGIVIAKSYEAKPYGIKTGTLLRDALIMCPQLLIVPSDHLFYQLISTKLKAFLQTKIPILEQYSIDEFWGDLKGWVKEEDTYDFIAALQKEVFERFDLPLSIGASSAKWIAKLATDFNKPYGLTIVPKENIHAFVAPMPMESFPGIGRALAKKLSGYCIKTLGDVIEHQKLLCSWGRMGKDLVAKIQGLDNEAVVAHRDRKSIGISRNFPITHERDEIKRRIIILTRHLSHTITKLALCPSTYYLKIRYDNGSNAHLSKTIERGFSEHLFKEIALQAFVEIDAHPYYGITHLSISASNFITPSQTKTFSLFTAEKDEKSKKLEEKITKLRDKYGIDIVRLGVEKNKSTE